MCTFYLVGVDSPRKLVAHVGSYDYEYEPVAGMSAYGLYDKVASISKYSTGKALAYLKKNTISGTRR